jgi:hypothetical protein
MKLIIMLSMILSHSCSTGPSSDDSIELIRMWTNELNQDDVIRFYGPDYKQVESGITYQRAKSTWPRFAFFFDKDKKVKNQYALLNRNELDLLKKNLNCSWIETQIKSITPHAIQDIPTGECEKYSVKYEFKKDWGLYEVKREK